MSDSVIKIAGTGCALADFLYSDVNFRSSQFAQFQSIKTGDGGLSPGKLVFTGELESFANKSYPEILSSIVGNSSYNSFNIGGPSLVSLIHASQLLPENQFEVSYYGCTGNDETADLILEKVAATPLNIKNYIKVGPKETAFTHVLSDPTFDNGNGERTFINNIGASSDYSPEMLPASFFDAQIVCFGGTALVPQIHDNLIALLQKAKANHCVTVVNTVFDFRNEKANPGEKWPLGNSSESFKLTDVLIMDCEEALKISGYSSIDEAAIYFRDQKLSSFIITNGSSRLYAYSDGSLFQAVDITKFPISEKIKIELQGNVCKKGDTTGCGDNFAGGVIASVARQLQHDKPGKLDLVDAISWGVASGGFTCFYLGGAWFETRKGEKLDIISHYQNSYLKQIGK
ncbi:MAG TPA: carbohydrate kinase family protein [Prolixibacteraceae bacterium]|nr:carbohydrate kinase family protein [Prolixibacteraceae bacterium]